MSQSRIFSGIQPSGELHIGNYLGAVKNWVTLQRQYESFFCIVDYHAITQPYAPDDLRRRTRDMVISLLAAGVDPSAHARCSCSRWCRNIPSWRGYSTLSRHWASSSARRSSREKSARQESILAGILNYPVLQAADILLYNADLVPVGEDQVQHLELSRRVSRRWNARFDPAPARKLLPRRHHLIRHLRETGFFPEPKPLLTPTRRIMGLDGQAKMSKSLGNTVGLLEEPKDIWEKLRPAMTDPARVRRTDPARPKSATSIICTRRSARPRQWSTWPCSAAPRVGLPRLQESSFEAMDAELTPIRNRAKEIRANPSVLDQPLARGAEHARDVASATMREAKQLMGLT